MIQIDIQTGPTDPGLADQMLAQDLGFGRVFADQMFLVKYAQKKGWYGASIIPYGPFELEPSALVFHYGQEIFEGHKVYRWPDGRVAMFRPEANAARMNRSARRMRMPSIPEDFQLKATIALVARLKHWVPSELGSSLYLRPAMIATEAGLGVRPSKEYYYFIIASPSGPYFPSGFSPIKVRAESKFIRAATGGTGDAKTGGNYAGAMFAQADAAAQGYNAVLWLDAREHRYVEEIGAMNVLFVIDGKIVTSELYGSILPGITRDSILTMAGDLGYQTEERPISISELVERIGDGSLTEAFGAGTAAVITPIGTIGWEGKDHTINGQEVGPVANRLYKALTDIQYGRAEDKHGWMTLVP